MCRLLTGVFLLVVILSLASVAWSSDREQTRSSSYQITRYVMGSGGSTSLTGGDILHLSTLGEVCLVETWLSAPYRVVSGFWGQRMSVPTAVSDPLNSEAPTGFRVWPNYPNPFNPQTSLTLSVARASVVHVDIYDALGRRVWSRERQVTRPGRVVLIWDGRDQSGEKVSTGLYWARIRAESMDTASPLFQHVIQMTRVR